MIDSHCHLTYPQLLAQAGDVLTRAKAVGVERVITIATTAAEAPRAIEFCRAHPEVRCSIGVHPHHSNDATAADIEALRELQRAPEVVALGEMGLDYHYDFSPRPRQHEVFTAQLELAKELGRPIVIHCREAIDDCLGILKDFEAVPALFHCFTGTLDEARRILGRGYLIGFTGVVTYKKSDELREVARVVPADQFVVETDAPYLSPEPVRKQRVNEPSFVIHTAAAVAKARDTSIDEIDRLTTANVRRFFRWE
jgi:TatD DNase family protein